jgi:hypothetical protein
MPPVTVIVPCLNERRFIGPALRSLLDGSHRDLEVLVLDGGSRDGTRDEVAALAAADPRVRLCDNPRGTTPAALNLGLSLARGEVIVRADAHAMYPPDYVAVLVRTLARSGADLVGCPADALPGGHGRMARWIALACGSRFATASPFRARTRGGVVDTVPFGCWRRELFARVGGFDERLLRNQDNEHASRIRRAGGRVLLTTETRVGSIVRGSLGGLCRHAARAGMWNAFAERLHPHTFRWRHFLPGLFFVGVLACSALAAGGLVARRPGWTALAVAPLVPYAVGNALSAWRAARSDGRARWAAPIAGVLFAFHFSYGYGVAGGWLRVALGRWRHHLGKVDS